MNIYENRTAACIAASDYQVKNGGTITEGHGEDTDDDGKTIGVYDFIAVAQGATDDNPLGESWEEFPFDYEPA